MARTTRTDAAPWWLPRADAWFKLLGAIIFAYLVLARLVGWLIEFGDITVIAVGGMLTAYLVLPAVQALNRRLPLWFALTIVYAGIVCAIVLVIVLVAPTVVAQFQALVAYIPTMQKTVEQYLSTTNNPIVTHLPPELRGYVTKVPAQITTQLQGVAATLSSRVVNAVVSLLTIGALVVAIPVVSIYMLAESTTMKRFVARLMPASKRQFAMDLLGDIDAVIGGFVRGQLIVAGTVAALAIAALLLLHVPYAVLIGLWAGIADIAPYVGPFAGGIPAVLVALFANGWVGAVEVVVAFTIINQIEAHILGPRIVSSTVKVTPLAVIFALLIGAHVLGFLGLLIGVPIAGVIRVVLTRLFPDDEITNAEIRPGLTQKPQVDVDPRATEA
ncbi:MAG TPA: AI-2E family transporter [Candidatus Elarobacter sp.]